MWLNRYFNPVVLIKIVCITVLMLNGCNIGDENHKSLRIGMNTWPGYEPFVLAKEKGYLAKNVYISRVDSATDVIKALHSDIIDVACVTLDEAMIYQDKSTDHIKIITIMDFSVGGDAVVAKKEIASMVELKGKRIGVESSALGAFMISRAVELTPDLQMNDLKIVNLGYEHHEKEFLEGRVDAIVTFEPVKTKLLQGNAHVLFDSTQIPAEIIDVMVVKEKSIVSKSLALQAMVDAWYRSVEYIAKQPESTKKMMAAYEGLSYGEFKVAYRGIKVPSIEENKAFFNRNLSATIIKMEKNLLQKKLIRQKVVPSELYTNQFLVR